LLGRGAAVVCFYGASRGVFYRLGGEQERCHEIGQWRESRARRLRRGLWAHGGVRGYCGAYARALARLDVTCNG
jgi:hypothetical protein